ncbi:L10-interacting MYB domain-containing protein [Euphorbia peplus]|nr:L10-interacting MYB domain-containing protein [Euphorbia peplus]
MTHNSQKQSTQEPGKTKAVWSLQTTHTFCDICISAITKGLRHSTHFNAEGWKFVISNFQKETGLMYDKGKLKNKWDLMRGEWKLWKELIGKETGLGWNPRLETVDATAEWWDAKILINKDYAKFRKKRLDPDISSKNDYMFGSTVATGEFAWIPSANENEPPLTHPSENRENVISLNDSGDDPLENSMDRFLEDGDEVSDGATNLGKRQKIGKVNDEAAPESKKRKGRAQKVSNASKFRSDISRLVATVEKRNTTEAGCTIKEVMEDLHSISDIPKYIDLYYFAVSMFEHKAKRELWKNLETPDAKVGWLKYEKGQRDIVNAKT